MFKRNGIRFFLLIVMLFWLAACNSPEPDPTEVAEAQPIVLKGICNGLGEGDADLGIAGDVYLVRCYVVRE